jgi:hypothetical protein
MKISALISLFGLVAASVQLSGCTNQGAFPSLAKRPFEKNPQAQRTAPVPLAPLALRRVSDPALLVRISAAIARARSGVQAFELALPAARSAVVGGAGSSMSDRWINAQVFVTRLERTLEPARFALSDLDVEQRHVQLDPASADGPTLAAAITEVEAITKRQSAEISGLLAMLSR